MTASLRKQNPRAGGDVSRPTEAHFVCGPEAEVEQQESTEWQRGVGLDPVEITTDDGTRVLGGPAGSPSYCHSFAENFLQEVTEDLDAISRMLPLQAQHCLTVGSFQHRVNHLWRMIPGGENSIFGDLMHKYNEASSAPPGA